MSEWTKEPPTESGWHWYRDLANDFSPEIFWVDTRTLEAHAHSGHTLDMILMPGEWWPEPIQQPQ